jgi:hypothetical protein
MSLNPLNDISKVYLEQVSESAVPGKPAEKLGAITAIPKSEQEAARERLLAKTKAKRDAMKSEELDPVGQEDADIDNDGDTDKSDKYLHKRRKSIGKAIAQKSVKEGYSNWRQDLSEVMDDAEAGKKIKEKNINNKVKTSAMGGGIKIGEAIEEIGGTLIEMVEIDEEELKLHEKAESEQQQKLFGLALSVKRGKTLRSEASPEVLKIVDSMSEKKIRDFAKTKHEGIPKKVEEELTPTTSQQFAAQRQLAMAQKRVTAADQAALRVRKKEMQQQQQEEFVSEEDYDRMKDERMMRGGVGGNINYRKPTKTGSSKPVDREKQKETARKALDMVRQQTISKYGKGSLM